MPWLLLVDEAEPLPPVWPVAWGEAVVEDPEPEALLLEPPVVALVGSRVPQCDMMLVLQASWFLALPTFWELQRSKSFRQMKVGIV